MKAIGCHKNVELYGEDINGNQMVICHDCGTDAHAINVDAAEEHLRMTPCVKDCQNCKSLRRSSSTAPAVPKGGNSYDKVHICPFDHNKWWQYNNHFHFWKQVTNPLE